MVVAYVRQVEIKGVTSSAVIDLGKHRVTQEPRSHQVALKSKGYALYRIMPGFISNNERVSGGIQLELTEIRV